jgi:hypothetical protein
MTKLPVLFAVVTFTFGVAQASTIYVNTFDLGQVFPDGPGPAAPLVPTDINGADTLDALGVTFSFSEGPSLTTATYGANLGTTGLDVSPISDPVLLGAEDGILTLNFAYPTDFVSFDILFATGADDGGEVTIGGVSTPYTTTGDSGLDGLFSIGSFSSAATTTSPFTTAVVAFDGSPTQFAIDNLSFDTPEPGSITLLVAGALLLGALLRLRRPALRA